MSFLFTVNGITRNQFVRYRTLQIRKDGAIESARLELLAGDADALNVIDGDTLHITQDGALEFGGEVISVRVQRFDRSPRGSTVTTVDAQGWRFEADDMVISAEVPAMPLLDLVEWIRATYLSAKGWTNNGALSGGPMLPALTFVRQSIGAIYDEVQKLTGWLWRVNGDRVFSFQSAGSLRTPVDLTSLSGSVVLTGVAWSRQRLRQATRVFTTTGGSGRIAWTDAHTGNGTVRVFPLSVIPMKEAPPTEVIEGGTTHAIGGGRWTFDVNESQVIAATPVAAAAAVTVAYGVDLPVTVRVFDPSTRNADGSWNFANVIDALLTASEQTDIAQAISWSNAELSTRMDNPRALECSTFAQGFYPWQQGLCSFPERGINGQYLVQSTLLTDVGRVNAKPRIDLALLEGSAIGRDWTQYFKERSGNTGGGGSVSTGGGVPPASGGGGGGGGGLPAGTTFRLAGDNITVYTIDNTRWHDAPQLSPTWLGGAGMAGQWTLMVPVYQLTAGTTEIRLLDQTTQQALALLATTAVGERLIGPWDFQSVNFAAPADVHGVLLQWRTTSGSRQCVMGHATVRKV